MTTKARKAGANRAARPKPAPARRSVYEELRRTQERLQVALEGSRAVTWAWEIGEDRIDWIPDFAAVYGETPNAPATFDAWLARVRPEDRDRLAARIRRILSTPGEDVWDEEFCILHPDFGERCIGALGRAYRDAAGRAVRMAGVNFDITERKRATAALFESEGRFRRIFDNAVTGIAITHLDGRFTQCNAAYCRLLGYTEDELRRVAFATLVHPEDREANLVENRRLRSGEIPYFEIENRYLRKGGEAIWVQKFVSLLRDERGEPTYLLALVNDVSARKRAEAALRESEATVRLLNEELARRIAERTVQWADQHARLQAIVETAAEGVITCDRRGIIDSANAAALRIFGYGAEEVIGRNVTLLMGSPDREHHDAYIARYLATGKARVVGAVRPVTGWHKEGRPIPLELSLSEIRTAGVRSFVAVMRDVSVQRRLEAQVRERLEDAAQLHRLGMAGELVGVLAHQLNQPLAAILSFAEAAVVRLRRGTSAPERLEVTLAEIIEQAHRAAQAIGNLRQFLSRDSGNVVPEDVNQIARRAVELMGTPAHDAGVALSIDLEDRLPPVRMRRNQIEQVMLLLLDNAIDAVAADRGGEAAPQRVRGGVCIDTALDGAAQAVRVAVTDTGPGLDAVQAHKVFEPLYTTKRHGVGLGLSIARSIVEAHGGRLWAEPANEGRFVFTLPLVT